MAKITNYISKTNKEAKAILKAALQGENKKAKYSNKKVVYDNITFDSTKECEYYKKLVFQKKFGLIQDFELQPKFPYDIIYEANGNKYKRKAFYKADFKIILLNDELEIIDVKGFKTATYKRKKRIIESLYKIKIIEA